MQLGVCCVSGVFTVWCVHLSVFGSCVVHKTVGHPLRSKASFSYHHIYYSSHVTCPAAWVQFQLAALDDEILCAIINKTTNYETLEVQESLARLRRHDAMAPWCRGAVAYFTNFQFTVRFCRYNNATYIVTSGFIRRSVFFSIAIRTGWRRDRGMLDDEGSQTHIVTWIISPKIKIALSSGSCVCVCVRVCASVCVCLCDSVSYTGCHTSSFVDVLCNTFQCTTVKSWAGNKAWEWKVSCCYLCLFIHLLCNWVMFPFLSIEIGLMAIYVDESLKMHSTCNLHVH